MTKHPVDALKELIPDIDPRLLEQFRELCDQPVTLRYVARTGEMAESRAVDAFLADLWAVFERHGLELSHEDHHGDFEVFRLGTDPDLKAWLFAASDNT